MSDTRVAAVDTTCDPLEFLATVSDRIEGFVYRCLNNRDYTMLRLSSGFERMLGLAGSEWVLKRRSFTDIIHPEDRERVVLEVDRAIAKGARWRLNYRLRASSGRYVPVYETGGAAIDDATGEVNLYGVVLDMRVAE